jgi:putative PIG3 family NAD(P)H quinone oxidoreductase
MRAVVIDDPGKGARLRVAEVAAPACGPDELRIRVAAFAVNRADLLQRRGLYPPPPGASEILGLECAGEVIEVGERVRGWTSGERVMALLAGGGYAGEVVVHAGSAMRVPERTSLVDAAAIPEAFLTVHLCLFRLASFPAGGTLLVQGGGGGIGTAAIQMAKAAGGRVVASAGSDEKCARCRELGAEVTVNYRSGSFVEAALAATGGLGVDVVLDHVGAPYLADHLRALCAGGRLVLIGLMGGARVEIDLALLLLKRLQVIGSTLRSRSVEEKRALVADFVARFGPALASGRIRPIVDRVLPMEEIEAAHAAMESSEHFGKIVLTTQARNAR